LTLILKAIDLPPEHASRAGDIDPRERSSNPHTDSL